MVAAASGIWLAALLFGHFALTEYESKAAAVTPDPARWPAAAANIEHKGWTLVVAAHPQCPCSRATVNELNRLMVRCTNKLSPVFLFYRPAGSKTTWNQTELWRSAVAIPGVKAIDDPDGIQSAQFNATTSGESFLYDPAGKLCFHGGITGGRGHEGDNDGEDTVVSLVNAGANQKQVQVAHTQFFGCSIR
jgi:hypothetical protein